MSWGSGRDMGASTPSGAGQNVAADSLFMGIETHVLEEVKMRVLGFGLAGGIR
jgi:hypothetical protein